MSSEPFTNPDVVFVNDKQRLLDMCLRNATKYLRGEIKLTMDLHAQMKYAFENSNQQTRELMLALFDMKDFLDNEDLT